MCSGSPVSGCVVVVRLLTVLSVRAASASETPPAAAAEEPRHQAEQDLINLPAGQPLRRFAQCLRLTHCFACDLTLGSIGQTAADFFALDHGSLTGVADQFARAGIHRPQISLQPDDRFT